MARINKTRFAILGCLTIRPMSAYEIKQFIHRSIAHFWSEGEGQLYPTLKKLHEAKLLSCDEQVAQKGGVKKTYAITTEGEAALHEWLQLKAERPVYRNELLLKLFFGSMQSNEYTLKILNAARTEAQELFDLLVSIKQALTNSDLPDNRLPYIDMCLEYGICLSEAEIKWCDRCVDRLSASLTL